MIPHSPYYRIFNIDGGFGLGLVFIEVDDLLTLDYYWLIGFYRLTT